MSTYRFECPNCDIEIITQGHELTECLYCRVTTDNTQTLYNALAELKASQDEVSMLKELIQGVDNIVHDSIGVAGYHNNGDIASWDEFEEIVEIQDALTNNQASETQGEG